MKVSRRFWEAFRTSPHYRALMAIPELSPETRQLASLLEGLRQAEQALRWREIAHNGGILLAAMAMGVGVGIALRYLLH